MQETVYIKSSPKLKILDRARYYVWASYRRKLLDTLLERHRETFFGIVLDIGGRARGRFEKPKAFVDRWIFADINPSHKPDIVLDVANMKQIENSSIDVICACELFEHVAEIERGLDECIRVLKNNGTMIVSVPFLYAIHADPSDYQRWTQFKWRKEIEQRSCHIETLVIMGRFFTVMSDHTKTFFKSLPKPLNWMVVFLLPILDLLVQLDELAVIQSNHLLGKFHGGYFMMIKKYAEPHEKIVSKHQATV